MITKRAMDPLNATHSPENGLKHPILSSVEAKIPMVWPTFDQESASMGLSEPRFLGGNP